MFTVKNHSRTYSATTIIFMLLLIFVFTLSCKLGGSNQSCTGKLTYDGQTFTGAGSNEDEAKRNACNKYCIEADLEFDARYRVWLDSAKGQRAGRPSKKESIYKDKDLLDYVTVTCSKKCVENADRGKYKLEASCN